MTLHSSGLQSQSKGLYREELSWLMEQEQQLLRQENERLKAEVHGVNSDFVQSREKIHQLDATILSLNKQKQHSHSSLLKALEQENTSLKQELEAKGKVPRGCDPEQSHTELDSLQQENEVLKAQMSRLSAQSFQVQFGGPVPPSPQGGLRGQQRGEDPDNMQLHRNGKADVLIKDLYVENSQLIKALEITEQRQKIAEKKNYLLEEKISSLNKIVRDLNPPTLLSLPYNYKCP